jgi:hypothetical protein
MQLVLVPELLFRNVVRETPVSRLLPCLSGAEKKQSFVRSVPEQEFGNERNEGKTRPDFPHFSPAFFSKPSTSIHSLRHSARSASGSLFSPSASRTPARSESSFH